MASALIGYTGFVGGNLTRSRPFDDLYNSSNIEEIAGRSFDLVVCAGAPAEKWRANRDPEGDRRRLARLSGPLLRASAGRVVLISTVDVYARPVGVDEGDDPHAEDATPYGRHRRELERRIAQHFDTLIVRLPGLFGPGLKKNAIFDLLHGNDLHKIDHRSVYQFYDLSRLWPDIEVALAAGVRLIHLATEPVSVREVARSGFGYDFDNELGSTPARYDFRSKYDRLYGGANGYLLPKGEVLGALRAFVGSVRGGGGGCG